MFQLYHICDKLKSTMMEKKLLDDKIEISWCLWCAADKESADLAQAVQIVTEQVMPVLSVAPASVSVVWPWLEDGTTKIMARFYVSDKKINEAVISDVVKNINQTFKQGADGAQVFLDFSELGVFVDFLCAIRDDLFFDKDLSIGLDLSQIGPFDWNDLFAKVRKINANSILFVFPKDTGNKSDFVGRIYAMLNAWNSNNDFELNFAFSPDSVRIEQVVRMAEQMQPQLVNKLKFFVNF